MKCKVIQGFIDKETNKAHEAGSPYECTAERFSEIQSKGKYLVAEADKTAEKGKEKPKTAMK